MNQLTISITLIFKFLSCKYKKISIEQLDTFKIIGISIETTNENRKSAEYLVKLWEKFYSKNIPNQIKTKEGNEIYSIYTDYETYYTGKYTSIIGLKINSLDKIPEGLIGLKFSGGKYHRFVSKG